MDHRGPGIIILTAILILSLTPAVHPAADPNKPHPHQGILAPYEPVAPTLDLDEKQLARLAKGKLVTMTIEKENAGGTGVGIIDIAAPPDIVWSRIKGFENYPEWVGPVKKCEVYRQAGDTTSTFTKISGFLYKYEYYLHNVSWPDQDMLTWTLDYDRYSDFDDCTGAWFVMEHPEKSGWSRAWFSSDLRLRSAIPGFLMNYIKKKGIKDATKWVKKQSEKAAASGDAKE